MAERQRLCSWCLQPFVWGHPCDPSLAVQSKPPKPRRAKPPKPPRYDRNYGVTPLGYSMVSPAVRARLGLEARPR